MSKRHCLLVSDDAKLLLNGVNFLSNHGYTVFTAAAPPIAFAHFGAEPLQLVILDLAEVADDATAICQVRARWTGAGLTALCPEGAAPARADAAMAAGAHAALNKPFGPQELLESADLASALQAGGRGLTLVVDDSRTIQAVARRALARAGLGVITRGTMEDALAALDKFPVDCVVTEIFMPGMGGIQGMVRLRRARPDLKIVAMSGGLEEKMQSDSALQAALKLGAAKVLPKPFSEADLVAAVA